MITRVYELSNARIAARTGGFAMAVDPVSFQVTMDSTWSPYVQGTLTLAALTSAQVHSIDPRSSGDLRFMTTLRETHEDGTVRTADFDLGLRDLDSDWNTGLHVLSVASDEAQAQDYGYLAAQTHAQATASQIAADAVSWMWTSLIVQGQGLSDPVIAAADAGTDVGTTTWDWVSGLAEAAGARFWVDERGIILWTPSTWANAPGPYAVGADDGIITVREQLGRSNPLWANSAVVVYSGNSPAQYSTDTAGVLPRKTLVVNRNRRKPGSGNAATQIRRNAQYRGGTLNIDALLDIRCRPNQTWNLTWADQLRGATSQSVSFSLPAGTMSVVFNVIDSYSPTN